MDIEQQLRLWADELHAIANEGMQWESANPYQVHRYDRVRRVAAALFAAQDGRDVGTIEQIYRDISIHMMPYSGGNAAVFNARGEILLIQRTDNKLWAMPGGALEVGESPASGSCREAWEETGVAVEPLTLVGVYDSRFCDVPTTTHMYHFVFLCCQRDVAQQPVVSNETLEVHGMLRKRYRRLHLVTFNGCRMRFAVIIASNGVQFLTDDIDECARIIVSACICKRYLRDETDLS